MRKIVGSAIFLLFLLQSNVFTQSSGWKFVEITSPAAMGSGEPNFSISGDRIYMSWLEPVVSGSHALRFAVWDGKNWSPVQTIIAGVPFFINWADFPSLMKMQDGTLVAHWLQKNGTGAYAYDVLISYSSDDGKTWSKPSMPHKDGVINEHGFVSLVDRGPGKFTAIWLDPRNIKNDPHDQQSSMAIMSADFVKDRFVNEMTLDPRVCDCCQTGAVATKDGMFVAFRDRSNSEVRDISYVRLANGKWSPPKILYADNWKIAACPVNGPAVSAKDNQLVVAWFTAAGDQGKVQAIFSNDGGITFGKPVRIDQGNAVGRVDVKWLPDGTALVSWLETSSQGAEIRIRSVHPDGSAGPYFKVAQSSKARASGFPRIISFGKDLLIAWTQAAEQQQIRVARLSQ